MRVDAAAVLALSSALLLLAACDTDRSADVRTDSTAAAHQATTAPVTPPVITATASTSAPPGVPASTMAPVAAPVAGPVPHYATTTNPLNSGGALPRLPCALPAWPDNEPDLAAFFTVAARCLDRAWQPVMATLGLPFAPVRVVLTDERSAPGAQGGRAVCPAPENNSFYCDGVIYLDPRSYLSTSTGPRGVPAAAIGLLAHEYGHHIQRLAGLLPEAVLQLNLAGPDTPAGEELSRRTELQAECFAGMFVATTFDPAGTALAQQDADTRGDAPGRPPDHGDPRTYGAWFGVGAQRDSLAACDTWSAPASAVR